jgi:hypothetical protein
MAVRNVLRRLMFLNPRNWTCEMCITRLNSVLWRKPCVSPVCMKYQIFLRWYSGIIYLITLGVLTKISEEVILPVRRSWRFYPEEEGSGVFRNAGQYLKYYTAYTHISSTFEPSPPWNPVSVPLQIFCFALYGCSRHFRWSNSNFWFQYWSYISTENIKLWIVISNLLCRIVLRICVQLDDK